MAGWLTVLVDNKDYVPISKLKESESGELNLTTMMPDQDRATIELYLRGGRYLEHLHTFEVANLHQKPERPRIVVSAHVRDTLNVTLRVDGELVESKSFPVPAAVHAINWVPWIWLTLILLLLAGATVAGFRYLPGVLERTASEPRQPVELNDEDAPDESQLPTEATRESEDASRDEALQDDASRGDAEAPLDAAEQGEPETRGARGPVGPVTVGAELPLDLIEQPLYFEPESAALLPETREQIDAIAQALAEATHDEVRVRVTGHTALFGTQTARIELSRRRAQNVASALRERLQRSGASGVVVVQDGVGGSEPITRDEADQWRNRRVVLAIEQR